MAISKNTHHNNCTVKAIKGPFGIHYGKLICSDHNKHIQWLNEQDFEAVVGILGKFNNKENWQFRIKKNGEIAVRPPKHLPKKSVFKLSTSCSSILIIYAYYSFRTTFNCVITVL